MMSVQTEPIQKREDFTEEELAQMSPLGRELWALRAKIVASGVPLLTWEQISCEVADRRGREYDEDDAE